MIDDALINEIHQNATAKGFWNDRENPYCIQIKLLLIHAEVSECVENLRQIPPSAELTRLLSAELADIVIRTLDLSAYLNIDILEAVRAKHEYNKGRPYKHGKEF